MTVSGWGRWPRLDAPLRRLRRRDEAPPILAETPDLVARGNGRAYGDAALNRRLMLDMRGCDRLIAFDPAAATVTCEAGLLLADLIAFLLPRGFFPAVTPGTRFVTVGGMIAADIHGKNHHRDGAMGAHTHAVELALADGSMRQVTRVSDPALFEATLGGMGLTGIILGATIGVTPVETPFLRQETLRAGSLAEAIALCEASQDWRYTAAWIDCVSGGAARGRSLIYRAHHAGRGEAPAAVPQSRPKRVPMDLPSFALNPWSVRAFNELYWRLPRPASGLVDYERYFYPLDGLLDWNRIYGRRGFTQYQCALPLAASADGLALLLDRIGKAGSGSFLAVLKRFGPGSGAPLSFPIEGYTLALDFPVGPATMALLDELDAMTLDHGGRLYLAKDARQSATTLRRGYPGLDRFLAVRERVDPGRKFRSLLSERLAI